MPIYVYRCSNCKREVEKLQHINDAPLTTCPECHTETMHKVVSNVGIIFKGSGFYVTDNPHSNSGSASHTHGTEVDSDAKIQSAEKAAESSSSASEASKSAAPAEGKKSSGTEKKGNPNGNKVA